MTMARPLIRAASARLTFAVLHGADSAFGRMAAIAHASILSRSHRRWS